MRLFGLNITLGLLFVAVVFYIVGARYPGLARKVGL